MKSSYDPALKVVGGSATDVEQLWSQAGQVLTKHRSSLSPAVFECIMYLKYNSDLWGLADVVEANRRRLGSSKAAQARMREHRERLTTCVNEINTWDKFYEQLESC